MSNEIDMFNHCSLLFGALVLSTSVLSTPALAVDGIEASVVKLNVTKREPDFFKPWTKAAPSKVSGSGAVIDGKRILTNAHVVLFASQVLVQLRQGGDQYAGKVTAIAPGMDLAIVEIADPSKLDSAPALELASELPQLKSHISVYGYPTGGDDLSVTDGIVSRIEFANYNFGIGGPRIQVDAALNPGNSGGPGIQDGKIAGLVFSKIEEADNIGYLIPAQEIAKFLADVKDGKFDGNPMMFDSFQTAENESLRAMLKLPADMTGIVVSRPYKDDDDYPLKMWDVVTHVGEHAVDNQGYVAVRDGLRMRFLYYVPLLAKDGKVELTIFRDGEKKFVEVPVAPDRELLIPTLKDKYPDYFIYGPLVFTAATQEYVRALGGAGLSALLALDSPMIKRLQDQPDEPGEQIVIIATRMFPHPMTKGYENRPFGVVEEMNGAKVKNLRHLAELLRNCDDDFVRLQMADRSEALVFKNAELQAATEEIVSDEGIRYQTSDALRDVWEKKD